MLDEDSTVDVYSTASHNAAKISFMWPKNPSKDDALYNYMTNDKVLDCSAGNI